MTWGVRAAVLTVATWAATGAFGLTDAVGADSARVADANKQVGPPPAGRYNGQLCVSTAGAAEQCGPVVLQFQSGGARVQVSDLVYHLNWRAPKTQMLLVLMHGSVQVDEFFTEGLWSKQNLRFKDPDKDVRYEVRWEARNHR
ncbi:MAG: hypothetical protein ACOVOX_14470 [Burkholderiaceae bacterium]